MQDGELIRIALLRAAARRAGRLLRVLEWGSGRSTLTYTKILADSYLPFYWLSLEYDRSFLETRLVPELRIRPDTTIRIIDENILIHTQMGLGTNQIEVVCWNRGQVRPFLDTNYVADRVVDLDDYVNYPTLITREFDLILIDGRKRRRCLLTALELMGPRSIVFLHDARRAHYYCAMSAYPAGRFIGDELWIGACSEYLLDDATGLSESGA
jgi:hypothetical protein